MFVGNNPYTIHPDLPPGPDSILSLGPVVYYNPSSIVSAGTDGATITQWSDLSGNSLHASPVSGTPILNIGSTGNQVQFDGAGWFDVAYNALYDFNVGTDPFTLIVREGDVKPTTASGLISKGSASSGSREYNLNYTSTATQLGQYLGGTLAFNNSLPNVPNRLIMIVCTGGNAITYVDDVASTNRAIGTGNSDSSYSLNIGSVDEGAIPMQSGSMIDLVAIVPYAIDAGEITAIKTEFQIN